MCRGSFVIALPVLLYCRWEAGQVADSTIEKMRLVSHIWHGFDKMGVFHMVIGP